MRNYSDGLKDNSPIMNYLRQKSNEHQIDNKQDYHLTQKRLKNQQVHNESRIGPI